MKGTELTKLYVFSEEGVSPKLEVKGDLPTNGSIALNDNCDVVASLTDGNYTVKKNLINDEYTVLDGNDANNNLVAPINNNTKKNEFFFVIGTVPTESLNGMTEFINDNDLKNFILSATAQGYNFYLDNNDAVLGAFELLAIPNIYSKEVAADYASRVIESLKTNSIESDVNNAIYYYITDEYIYLMEGIKEIFDDSMKQAYQSGYEELLASYKENGVQYLQMIY